MFSHIDHNSDTSYAVGQNNSGGTIINSKSSAQGIRFRIDNVEKMRLTDDGNVGIGTTSPGSKLHIKDGPICVERTFDPGNDTGQAGLVFKESGYDNCFYMAYDAGGVAGTDNEHLTFYNSGSSGANPTAGDGNPIMRLNGNGKVGIGIDNPQRSLTIYHADNPSIQLTNSGSGTGAQDGMAVEQYGSSKNQLFWWNGSVYTTEIK